MTANEIRNKTNWESYGQRYENPLLIEIAAQLAESNELKRLQVEAVNNLCGTINLLSHESHALNKSAGSLESIAVSLDFMVNRTRI